MNVDELIVKLTAERDFAVKRGLLWPPEVRVETRDGFEMIAQVYSANGIFIATAGAEARQADE